MWDIDGDTILESYVRLFRCAGLCRLQTYRGSESRARWRYAIVSSSALADAARKLQAMTGTITGTIGLVTDNTQNAKASA